MSQNGNGEEYKLPWHLNLTNWFIIIGVLVTCGAGWYLIVWPSLPLKDGEYSCMPELPGGIAGPGAVVSDGRVVDAQEFDMSTGATYSVPFSDPKKIDPRSFRLTSVSLGLYESEFVCEFEE